MDLEVSLEDDIETDEVMEVTATSNISVGFKALQYL